SADLDAALALWIAARSGRAVTGLDIVALGAARLVVVDFLVIGAAGVPRSGLRHLKGSCSQGRWRLTATTNPRQIRLVITPNRHRRFPHESECRPRTPAHLLLDPIQSRAEGWGLAMLEAAKSLFGLIDAMAAVIVLA